MKPDMAALREICAGDLPKEFTYQGEDGLCQQVNLCVVCDSPMREVKGKWACADQSCAMYGKEQKPLAKENPTPAKGWGEPAEVTVYAV